MPQAIITLTTDFGEKDHFAGAVKGALYSELETIRIVDISHCISPFHISEAAYIIQNAYKSFPPGSIHIIGIDSELNPENKHIAVYLDNKPKFDETYKSNDITLISPTKVKCEATKHSYKTCAIHYLIDSDKSNLQKTQNFQ